MSARYKTDARGGQALVAWVFDGVPEGEVIVYWRTTAQMHAKLLTRRIYERSLARC